MTEEFNSDEQYALEELDKSIREELDKIKDMNRTDAILHCLVIIARTRKFLEDDLKLNFDVLDTAKGFEYGAGL